MRGVSINFTHIFIKVNRRILYSFHQLKLLITILFLFISDDGVLHQKSYYNLTGMQFSTFDADHDMSTGNCAANYKGGWWFNFCHGAFLNGPWFPESWTDPWLPKYPTGTEVNGTLMLINSY